MTIESKFENIKEKHAVYHDYLKERYNLLGSGECSKVYEISDAKVLKVFDFRTYEKKMIEFNRNTINEKQFINNSFNPELIFDASYFWYKFLLNNPCENLLIPKVYNLEIDNNYYLYKIEIEKLQFKPPTDCEVENSMAYIIPELFHFSLKNKYLNLNIIEDIFSNIKKSIGTDIYIENNLLDIKYKNELMDIYKILNSELFKKCMLKEPILDIHIDNVMYRKNEIPVIIDPYI